MAAIAMNKSQILTTGALLCLFSLISALSVGLIHSLTFERIRTERHNVLRQTLNALVPQKRYDNALTQDTLSLTDPLLGHTHAVIAYRARQQGKPVAVVIGSIAPDGYNGAITLLVAINLDGSLIGVRVVSHQETPGLGDKIELQKSAWIKQFDGASLTHPSEDKWRVQKDGGDFLALTGATITPRAITKAVYNTLRYFKQHQTDIFLPSQQP